VNTSVTMCGLELLTCALELLTCAHEYCNLRSRFFQFGITSLQNHNNKVYMTKLSFPRSWLIAGFVTRLTRRVSLVEQEFLTLPEHLSSLQIFSGVRVTRSLVLYVCFVDRFLSFCTFSFGHCVVCSSSIYGFWLPLWYLQALLPTLCASW